jgi:glycosyltransferase involved in cell wall biosynthesis
VGIKDFLMAFRYERKIEKFSKEIGNIYDSEGDIVCKEQIYPEKPNCKIAFIVPEISKFSGGHTGILRLGTYLCEMGHEVHYIAINNVPVQVMIDNAKTNFPNWRGVIKDRQALKENKYDIGIATKWNTCYHLLAYQNNFGLKAYFIQDFEPFFYPMGDHYLLSLNTYKLGLKMISLGPWNGQMIKKFIPYAKVYNIEFPVELGAYKIVKREIKIEKNLKLAVYIKRDPKRATFLLLEHLKYLIYKMREKGIEVEVNFFGIEKNIKLPIGNNMGKLNTDNLIKLYVNAHFGIVASLTNISYVNYEMLACGLPVVDFADGSAPSFFTDKEMIFLESHPHDLYNKISYYMNNQNRLNNLVLEGQKKLGTVTWASQAKKFAQILFSKEEYI